MRAASALVAGLLAACAGRSAAPGDARPLVPAGVRLDDAVETYAVTGRTAAEVGASLARAAREATGTRFRGLHEYGIAWRWRALAPVPGGCAMQNPEVTVSSRIVVPRWAPPPDPQPGLAERWAAYDAALRVHERGHEALAVEAAGALARTFRALRAPSCAFAGAWIAQTGRAALADLAARERAYDDSTGHGRTQGAAWPPPAVPPDAIRPPRAPGRY